MLTDITDLPLALANRLHDAALEFKTTGTLADGVTAAGDKGKSGLRVLTSESQQCRGHKLVEGDHDGNRIAWSAEKNGRIEQTEGRGSAWFDVNYPK